MKDYELQKYYEAQLDLFSTPGWKDFMEKAEEIKAVTADITRCNSEKELFFSKGQLDILNWMVGWENLVREAIQQNEADL
jgi:hypothetical protein